MNRYVVIGLGQFGYSLAKTLVDKGEDVLVIDKDEERVQEVSSEIPNAVTADATDERAMQKLGIGEYDCAIISCGSQLETSILISILLKELGIKEIIAKANSEIQGKVLKKIGVNRVVFPELDMGIRLAHNLINPDILDRISLSNDFSIIEINTPPEIVGKAISEADIRKHYGINVLAVKQRWEDGSEQLIIAPGANLKLSENDILVVLGHNKYIGKFRLQK